MQLTKQEHRMIDHVYSDLDDSAAFTGLAQKLLQAVNKKYGPKFFSLNQVVEFLESTDAHTIFKQVPTIYKKKVATNHLSPVRLTNNGRLIWPT